MTSKLQLLPKIKPTGQPEELHASVASELANWNLKPAATFLGSCNSFAASPVSDKIHPLWQPHL
jgi:hypothetical protein